MLILGFGLLFTGRVVPGRYDLLVDVARWGPARAGPVNTMTSAECTAGLPTRPAVRCSTRPSTASRRDSWTRAATAGRADPFRYVYLHVQYWAGWFLHPVTVTTPLGISFVRFISTHCLVPSFTNRLNPLMRTGIHS